MIVRREIPGDHDAVRALVASVYSPELIDGLRANESWLPAVSFVSLGSDGEVIGHVGAARGRVGSAPALTLLPPSIRPDDRGRGVGQALMHTVLGAAEALDEPLVGVVAFPPEYYLRFGFHLAEGTPSPRRWKSGSRASWFAPSPRTRKPCAGRSAFLIHSSALKPGCATSGGRRALSDQPA